MTEFEAGPLERNRIRIAVVEDDADWLRGLQAYLAKEPDFDIVVTASSLEEAREALAPGGFDVVLMDVMLVSSSREGIALTAEVTSQTGCKVIMLTSMEDKDIIMDAFRAGAVDYHLKSNYYDIPGAIRSAFRNRPTISASVSDTVRSELQRLAGVEHEFKKKMTEDLVTPTERQILQLIDQGYSQSQIADRFVVSLRTIKVHVGNILRKMGKPSSKEAAAELRKMGLFDEREK
ncbi:response regulator transcription factor [Paenibacillus chartarius]|uniref:Response regulator transcription factor n=1 Tax=Paenibacillus chartarius TaxID=747481 RepID=A0ABV6DFI0_9BACL